MTHLSGTQQEIAERVARQMIGIWEDKGATTRDRDTMLATVYQKVLNKQSLPVDFYRKALKEFCDQIMLPLLETPPEKVRKLKIRNPFS